MKIAVVAAAFAACLVAPTWAHAGVYLHGADGGPDVYYNALASRGNKMPQPDADVLLSVSASLPLTGCGEGSVGCAGKTSAGHYEMILFSGPERRQTLLHELGHIVDETYLTARDRFRLKKLQRTPGSRTWSGGEYGDRPSEIFANSYAACAIAGIRTSKDPLDMVTVEELAYMETPAEHNATCKVILAAMYR